MKPQSTHPSALGDESGQAALVVALFLFFVFLAFAALSIDGAAFYLSRRDLQNVADAAALSACTALSQGEDTTAALNVALNTVSTNLGSWSDYVGSNPPATNDGVGAGLLRGVEVSDPQVRVALQRPVPTVLTQFVGRADTIVTAQARCDSRAGGGLMPIAIQRYDGTTGGSLRDYLGNKLASSTDPNPPPVPYPSDSVTVTWAGRYGPFDVPVPMAAYTTSDGSVSDTNTGPEVVLLGQSAETNNGENSMRDLVLLDVRNVASQNALEYYNGADSQANAAKDMSQEWIYQHGYPGPYPQVGSQVAILDGASNNFTVQAMDTAGYRPGDSIAAIIYDGFVWSTPDYAVTLTPESDNGIIAGYPIDSGTAVAYTIDIAQAGPQPWFGALNFDLSLAFNNTPLPPGTQVTLNGNPLTPGTPYTVNGVTQTGWNGTLRIWSSEAITQVQYLSGLNLIVDSNLGLPRGASSNFGFGPVNSNDYAVRSSDGRLFVRQGNSISASLITFSTGASFPNNGQGCSAPVHADILLNSTLLPWGTYFSSAPDSTVNIRRNQDKSLSLALNALATAPVGSYTLRLTVNSPCNSTGIPSHSLDIPLVIQPPAPNATPNKFVFIQGYAVFRISRVDANDVWGYAISSLYQSYEDIRIGLRPRLVPWN
jgi:hypothetical protein